MAAPAAVFSRPRAASTGPYGPSTGPPSKVGSNVPLIPGMAKRAASNGALHTLDNPAATAAAIMAGAVPKKPTTLPDAPPVAAVNGTNGHLAAASPERKKWVPRTSSNASSVPSTAQPPPPPSAAPGTSPAKQSAPTHVPATGPAPIVSFGQKPRGVPAEKKEAPKPVKSWAKVVSGPPPPREIVNSASTADPVTPARTSNRMLDGAPTPGESTTTPTPVGRNKVSQLQQRLATGALPDDEGDTTPLVFQTGLFRNPLFDRLVASSRFMRRELQQLYRTFKSRCPSGHVDKATFAEVYAQLNGSPVDNVREYADLVFDAFEQDGKGTISFMEYITMLSVCRRGDSREKLLCVFRIYDNDGDGLLDREETHQLAASIYNLTLYKDSAVPAPHAAVDELTALLFDRMDGRRVGRVTASEFVRACERDETIGNIVRLTLKTPASAYDASSIHLPPAPDAAVVVEPVPEEPKKSSLEVYMEKRKASEAANPVMLQFKRPPIVRKVKRKKAHPYSDRHCPACPEQRCIEVFEPNVFKANVCKWCAHTHTLKEFEPKEQPKAPDAAPPPASEQSGESQQHAAGEDGVSFAMAASLAGIAPEVLASLPAHVLQAAMDEAAAAMAAEPAPLPLTDEPLPTLHKPTQAHEPAPIAMVETRRLSATGAPAPAYDAAPAASPPPPEEAVASEMVASAVAAGVAAGSRRASQRHSQPATAAETQALEAALAQELGDSLDAAQANAQWANAHNLLRDEAERLAREEAERVALEELRAMSVKAEQRQSEKRSSQDKERIRSSIVVGDASAATLMPAGADLEGWRAESGENPARGLAEHADLSAINSDRSNDAAILLAMAKTNPAAYLDQRQRASTLTSRSPGGLDSSPPKMDRINEGEDEEILRIANESGLFTMDGTDYTLSLVENNLTEQDEEKDAQGRRFHVDRTGMRVYRAGDVVAAHRLGQRRGTRGSKGCASQ
eukprot:m.27461 g.27461  ORF g.27461 m.27461 type:complete len:964 (-) comp9018_c0_seq1:25-2916(-)